ncbi:ArsR/SmtB family transcription factor [Oceanirhabdus sp. W0125-5]|uniref:ArsR/SmtB family transcription factor n=1 Tax=Oceanirhabdus sp. W0125-5 TaxID=2999116 RepID=UPI0022F30DD8|nr:metalloregulator ArsR/SmtB family transcription factor [Oceanirhabdus sp. W0125-5]WBW98125.1 metalloregulator ArsR/SmtB family transcription factor [Oceanirhabdus sp. W0125-5]
MDKLTDFLKIISDETRLRILILLYHKKLCVCQICGVMGETQPKISKHLAKLRDIGFVKDERLEKFVFYRLTIEEPMYKEILIKIIDSVDDNSIFGRDMEKIKDAEKYLKTCKGAM